MSQALTLAEAAERLAPVFVEEPGSSLPVAAKPSKGKWMSLEDAGAFLSERVTGQQMAPKKKKAEVTVSEAAKQIEGSQPETPLELAEIRAGRLIATSTKLQRLAEFQDFMSRAALPFEGMDETTALASPEFTVVYGCAQQLRSEYESSLRDEFAAWERQCLAENAVFEEGRPDWSSDDAWKVAALLANLGVSEQEIMSLWLTPAPVNIAGPACLELAQLVAGTDNPDPISAALGSVGFDDGEISSVMSGEAEILLRDHRIQELVARAADAYTATENRAAA
jgi:hypothetical protein